MTRLALFATNNRCDNSHILPLRGFKHTLIQAASNNVVLCKGVGAEGGRVTLQFCEHSEQILPWQLAYVVHTHFLALPTRHFERIGSTYIQIPGSKALPL